MRESKQRIQYTTLHTGGILGSLGVCTLLHLHGKKKGEKGKKRHLNRGPPGSPRGRPLNLPRAGWRRKHFTREREARPGGETRTPQQPLTSPSLRATHRGERGTQAPAATLLRPRTPAQESTERGGEGSGASLPTAPAGRARRLPAPFAAAAGWLAGGAGHTGSGHAGPDPASLGSRAVFLPPQRRPLTGRGTRGEAPRRLRSAHQTLPEGAPLRLPGSASFLLRPRAQTPAATQSGNRWGGSRGKRVHDRLQNAACASPPPRVLPANPRLPRRGCWEKAL